MSTEPSNRKFNMKKYAVVFFLSFVSFITYNFFNSSDNRERISSKGSAKTSEIVVNDSNFNPYSSKTEDKNETSISKTIKNPFVSNTALLKHPDIRQEKKTEHQPMTNSVSDLDTTIKLQENFSTDMNGNEVAVPFMPVSDGIENEFGEGIAKEFEPKVVAINTALKLEKNYISSDEGDIANPIMLEGNDENEAFSLTLLEENSSSNEYNEGIAKEFEPEIIDLETILASELEENFIPSNESDMAIPLLLESNEN